MTDSNKVSFLLIGKDPILDSAVQRLLPKIEIHRVECQGEKLLEALDPPPGVVLCGAPEAPVTTVELGQILSSEYIGTPVYLIGTPDSKFDRKELKKNGFTDLFLLPTDQMTMNQRLDELIVKIQNSGIVYRQVKLIDVAPETTLDFDTYLYLPANNRHFRFTASGEALSQERSDRLKKHQVGSLSVSSTDLKKFYEYSAKRLKELQTDSGIGETERSERLTESVRELFGTLFSDTTAAVGTGKETAAEVQKIVKEYVLINTDKDWYNRILATVAQSADSYSHAGNVSTYATLFAIGLGLKTIEEIAMAAILHDIGLEKIPAEILNKPQDDWTPKEKELYQKHPDFSIERIIEKKLILSDLIRKIILQHHEKWSGTGYPKAIAGAKICIEAQVLSIADRFDELTTLQPGRPRISPEEAVKKLHKETLLKPGQMAHDPDLLKKILALFPEQTE